MRGTLHFYTIPSDSSPVTKTLSLLGNLRTNSCAALAVFLLPLLRYTWAEGIGDAPPVSGHEYRVDEWISYRIKH